MARTLRRARHVRLVVQRIAIAAVLAGPGTRAAGDALAPPAAGAQGIHRVHLPRVDNREVLAGRALAPGPLVVGRTHRHTLTRLDDGRVLVVGDSDAVELWDPRTGRFRLTAPLPGPRSYHAAVRLADGRVLVAGGLGDFLPYDDGREVLASALIFDPAGETWHPAAALSGPMAQPEAVALPDGRVLLVGSIERVLTGLAFSPERGTWEPFPIGPRWEYAPVLVPLPNGRVLAIHDPGTGGLTADVLDPASDTWHPAASPATAGRLTVHVGLADGRVLIVCGPTTEVFDPVADRWSLAAPPPSEWRWEPKAVLLADGSALFVGGLSTSQTYRYHPSNDRWSVAGYTEHAHSGHAFVRLADGRVLLAGGNRDNRRGGEANRVAELYDPALGAWTASSPAPQGRTDHTATALASGHILLAGGRRGLGGYTPRPVVVLPALASWVVGDPLPVELVDQVATMLLDGQVLLTGGHRPDYQPVAQAILIDPVTLRWRQTAGMSVPRAGHASVGLLDGRVLVAGSGSAEVFDPATEAWSPAGAFEPHRNAPRLVRLDDGDVLMIGGRTERSADRFDPDAGLWRALAPLPANRRDVATAVLQDGRVLVAGGCCSVSGDNPANRNSFLFDPRTETWSETAPLLVGRTGATAFTLPDGSVLVVGGCCVIDSAERYDPSTGTWRPTGSTNLQRTGMTPVQRADGTVVVTGGCCDDVPGLPYSSSEWFDAAADAWRLVEAEVVMPASGAGPLDS